MGNVQNAVGDGDKKHGGAHPCGACGQTVVMAWFTHSSGRRLEAVEQCAQGAGTVAVEATLGGLDNNLSAYPCPNTAWRKHHCNGARAFSADGMGRKTREKPGKSPSISYRPTGSVNSRGCK
jgi:hypothetical protein